MRCLRLFVVVCLALAMIPASASAQRPVVKEEYAVSIHVMRGLMSQQDMQEMRLRSERGLRYKKPPALPQGNDVAPVQYKRITPSRSIQLRVENMVNGITIDIPPEYDHYGHKIRQLMAHVEEYPIYTDDERLDLEYRNVRKARIVFDYWKKALAKEREAIDAHLAKHSASPSVYRTLKYNQDDIDKFLKRTYAWIELNYQLLDLLVKRRGTYRVKNDLLVFDEAEDAQNYLKIFYQRQEALKLMREEYAPFRNIVF